jgi:hypothetical protein
MDTGVFRATKVKYGAWAAKAHRPALFAGRREVAGYETLGRVYFVGGTGARGGEEARFFPWDGQGSNW